MKKYLLPVIQILITVGLLCWIFRDPDQNRKMLEAIGKAKADGGLWWFLPGIAALGVAILLQTWRWMILGGSRGVSWRRSQPVGASSTSAFRNRSSSA